MIQYFVDEEMKVVDVVVGFVVDCVVINGVDFNLIEKKNKLFFYEIFFKKNTVDKGVVVNVVDEESVVKVVVVVVDNEDVDEF